MPKTVRPLKSHPLAPAPRRFEWRITRNILRQGDPCKVRLPGDAFRVRCRFQSVLVDEDGEVLAVEVIDPRSKAWRTVTPDRVQRLQANRPVR